MESESASPWMRRVCGAGVVELHGVDEQVVGGDGEGADGGEHGEARGLDDVDAVDGGGVDFGDGDGERGGADEAVEGFALRVGELFGVLEAGAGEIVEALGQDDGGGDDGAEEAAAAHLVDAGDRAKAAEAQGLFVRVGADQELQHALLDRGGGDGARGTRGVGHKWSSRAASIAAQSRKRGQKKECVFRHG